EARASSDPLSGFFVCRRRVVDGIEFRPVGFKILLELLVCVPHLKVADVAVRQERRAAGDSKASLRQGLLYAGHLRSLFVDVPGSARRWKFALVGASGLAIFLPLLWAFAVPGGFPPLLAFLPAFALSLAWNGVLNWRWTFADQRAELVGARRYADLAVLSGCLVFGVFALLVTAVHVPVLAAGAAAAAAGMTSNAVLNRRSVAERPSVWAGIATDQAVQAILSRLASLVGAGRAFILPAGALRAPGVPAGVLQHVTLTRHPLLLTEAPSHRAQRRSNIDATSLLLLPVVDGDRVAAVVVCERQAPRGFDPAALDAATRLIADLLPLLAESEAHPEPRQHRTQPEPRPAR
ncbi:MAG: GtrA family protein, partial [Candidatus Dormibacteraeota bacterium]|nr:GtrA family protein [Candidatus Dormibacteraeota bacterium]